MPHKTKSIKRPWIAKEESKTTSSDFYRSKEWRKLRAIHLSKEPFCRDCKKEGRIIQGRIVDHIHEINQGGGALDENNLQTLCQTHHNRKTKKNETRIKNKI